jgi:hypothetical protein
MRKNNAEEKKLMRMAKKCLKKKIYKKIKALKSKEDKIEALKYSIPVALEIHLNELEKKIEEKSRKGKEVFHLSAKCHIIMPKIRMLKINFHEKDFKTLTNLINSIEKGVKNV